MDALDIVLIALVAILATALLVSMRARMRDRRALAGHRQHVEEHKQQAVDATTRAERQQAEVHTTRADATEKLAEERAARQRLEAELHEARARITELEGAEQRQPEPAGRFSRR
ncbi:MAG: hypothetical protein M3340_01530 [Actinomycetota bacterium]|nr:hypothetical protein [Actinomycetota bacterium]